MNWNKLLELFISNLSNVIVHTLLEKATEKSEIASVYAKEMKNSREISKIYREKINPLNTSLPEIDINYIKGKIKRKVQSELLLRISKGYTNINLDEVDEEIDKSLKEMKVIWLTFEVFPSPSSYQPQEDLQ